MHFELRVRDCFVHFECISRPFSQALTVKSHKISLLSRLANEDFPGREALKTSEFLGDDFDHFDFRVS